MRSSLSLDAGDAKPACLYKQLQPLRNGHTREEVAQSQRGRLFGAMIVTVAERGYAASTVNQLCARAGVSKRTLYDHFPSKEACFLATYDLVVYRTLKRVRVAYASAADWHEGMQDAFGALASEVCEQPDAARLALIEATGAGRGALERVDRAARTFEQMIREGLAENPDDGSPEPLIVKGLAGGIVWALRLQLAADSAGGAGAGSAEELSQALLDWVLSYRSATPAKLVSLAAGEPSQPAMADGADWDDEGPQKQRRRMLRSALRIAARGGCANLTMAQIVQEAEVSDESFLEFFKTCEQCLLQAVRQGTRDAYRYVTDACAEADPDDWEQVVRLGSRALMQWLASDPAFARVAFGEIFLLGQPGVRQSLALMDELAMLLADGLPPERRPSELVARAIAGAVWELVHHYVTHDGTHGLADIADTVSYLVVATVAGGQGAAESIAHEGAEAELVA